MINMNDDIDSMDESKNNRMITRMQDDKDSIDDYGQNCIWARWTIGH